MTLAGTALIDITPAAGLAMAGFAARIAPAAGAHDALSLRALALDEVVILIADVIGVDLALGARVAARTGLDPERLILAASHTHGGPASMAGRLGQVADPAFLQQLEEGCVQAVIMSRQDRRPARLLLGQAQEPGYAQNRRHADGPVDRVIPILRVDDLQGQPLAILTICACHPVVLGADNLLWTADYPHYLRKALEEVYPGAMAIHATGFAGDVNTGHKASASFSTAPQASRSFAQAERMGIDIAGAVHAATLSPVEGPIHAAAEEVALAFAPLSEAETRQAALWLSEARTASPDRGGLLKIWADWYQARDPAPTPLRLRVQGLAIGPSRLLALPGEIFAQTAVDLRAAIDSLPLFLLGYAADNPGYIAPATEYAFGGYEIEEAHRFYGMPAAFARGAAEDLQNAALRINRRLDIQTKSQSQGDQA